MSQDHGINRASSFAKGIAGAILILILFTLPSLVNKSEAGWIHTQGEDFAADFIRALQARDLAQIQPYLDPILLTPRFRKDLDNAVKIFPQGEIKEITRLHVAVHYSSEFEGRREALQFYVVMEDPDAETGLQPYTINVNLLKKDHQFKVQGFQFDPAEMGLMDQFPYTLASWIQPKNAFVAVGVINVLFVAAALGLLVVRPVKNKLLWLPVVFVGFTEVTAQWVDDGPWSFSFWAVKYPATWINEAAGQDPWSIVVAFPLGAIVVLVLAIMAKPVLEATGPTVAMTSRPRVQPRSPRRPTPKPQPVKSGK